jgi:hypothetical protein
MMNKVHGWRHDRLNRLGLLLGLAGAILLNLPPVALVQAAPVQLADSRSGKPPGPEDRKPGVREKDQSAPAERVPGSQSTPERVVPGGQVDHQRTLPGQPVKSSPEPDRNRQPASRPERLSAEEWKVERERLREEIAPKIKLKRAASEQDPDIAYIDSSTFVRFKKRRESVDLEEIYGRDLERGSGSVFTSEALKRADIKLEQTLRLRNITDPQTSRELAGGMPPQETKLGRYGAAVAEDFGKKVKKVDVQEQLSEHGNGTGRTDMVLTLE